MITVKTRTGNLKLPNRTLQQTLQSVHMLLKRVGWIQHFERQNDNESYPIGFCLVGAIREVDGRWKGKAVEAVVAEVRCQGYSLITDYNDAPERTRAEVLQLVTRAIKKLPARRKVST